MNIQCTYLLLIVLVAAFDVIGGSIDCFQCTDIDNIENCHHITVCQKASEVCFTKATRSPGNMKYSLGCEEQTHCGKNLIGRAIDANGTSTNTTGTLVCEECCTVPGCNKALCSVAQTSSSKDCNKTCSDSPSFDCATIDATFGICHDIHHAKKACRNFCGLCCLVDGAWSNWSSWSSCSVTCGNGTETRLRSCDNPPPVNGGLACAGLDTETKQCARDVCPINGQWSAWGQWTACSASCGYGVIKRHRNCDNPPPSGYGNHCFGDGVDFSICSKTQCGVNGGWTAWSSWSTCSATCERGMSTRSRNCSNPIPSKGGRQCIGNNQGYMLCDTNKACPLSGLLFTQWSPWTNCSENLQYRNRKCFLYGAVISLANCTSGKTVDFKSCDTSAG